MSQDKIIFEVVATAKGVKVVQQQTDKLAKSSDKAAKSTKNLDKSRDAYNRREKGAAGISSNSTKNFSKMQQGIDGGGGSGGLVRAYALLAANVFALTAAFGVLSRSAQIDTLTKSMEILSTTGGTYIKTLAMDLRDASGGAIDLAQSFRQVSLATSAGLNTKEIEGLTMVAKGAALSLGRDLPDAMDRIFRGAIKLEPEILDEIGLFIRVDEAAEKYARQLGKSASALSQAEKRQGFLNEILDQGTRKFSAYADTVKPDPYVKIAAALSDVAQSALSLINGAFGPMIGFLAESKTLLTLVFGAVVFNLLRMAVPAIGQFNQGMAESAKKAADNAREYSEGIRDTTKAQIQEDNKKVKSALNAQVEMNQKTKPMALKVGGKDASSKLEAQLQDKTIKGKKRQALVEKRIKDLKRGQNLASIENQPLYQAEIDALEKEKQLEKEIVDLRTKKGKAKSIADPGTLGKKRQETLDQKAMTAGALSSVTTTAELKGMGAGYDELKDKLKNGEKQADGTRKKFTGLRKGAFALRGGFSIAAVGAQNLMMSLGPIIMIVTLVLPLLIAFAKYMGFMSKESKAAKESIGKLNSVLETLGERMKSQTDQMKDENLGFTEQAKAATAFSKSMMDVANRTKDVTEKLTDFRREASDSALGWDTFVGFISGGRWGVQASAESAILKGAIENLGGAVRAGEEDLVNLFSANLEGSDDYVAAVQAQILAEENKAKVMKRLEDESGKFKAKEKAELAKLLRAELTGAKTLDPAKKIAMEKIALDLRDRMSDAQIEAANAALALAQAQQHTTKTGDTLKGTTEDLIDANETFTEVIDGKAIGVLAKYDEMITGLSSALEGASESVAKFNSNFITTTKVDDLSSSFSQLSDKLVILGENGEKLSLNKAFAQDLATNDDNPFSSLFTDKEKDVLKGGGKDALKVWQNAQQEVKAYQKVLITLKTDTAKLKTVITKLGQAGTINDEIFKEQAERQTKMATVQRDAANLALANRLRNKNMDETQLNDMGTLLAGLDSEIDKEAALVDTNMTLTEFYGAQADHHAAIQARLAQEVASLTEVERAGIQITKAALAHTDAKKELNKALQTEAKLTMQIAKLSMTGTTTLNAGQEATLKVKAAVDAFNITKEEVGLKMTMLDYEMTIQQIKLEVLQKEHNIKGLGVRGKTNEDGTVTEATGMFADMDNAQTKTKTALQKTLDNADGVLNVAISEAVAGGFKDGIGGGIIATKEAIAAISSSDATGDEKAAGVRLAQTTALRSTTVALAEDMKKLGPEGEAGAAAALGALAIVDAYSSLDSVLSATGENAATFGEKVAAGFEFAAAALGQISNMMAAESRAAIAVVDKQIEAEKKRDGKSSESIAKIGAMEKKKEAMKKKAFEQDKKMKMAQTVASTAAGMIGVFAGVRDPLFSMSLAVAQAAVIGAMGAASLAMIAKTSYQGGGGSIDAPKPAKLAIGKRDNKVDVSRGASGGEMNYMRGGRGVGSNANDFKPIGGAYGMKSYASGGEGILVGEQGPEVVKPTQPIDVVQPGMGDTQNVNFTINTIDSQGVEDFLDSNAGAIISTIRGSANGYGTPFLEQIDTDAVGVKYSYKRK